MAFSYSASTRLQPAGSSSVAASSSLSLHQQQQQFLQQNPQIQPQQQQHQFLQQNHQFQQQQEQQQHPFYAMDSSSGASSSSYHHQYQEQHQQQQAQQSQSPRPLQGPRPAPLKVSKESYKIKKPPVAPGGVHHHHHHNASGGQATGHQQNQLPRQPVIIYTVSPKVIHAKPGDFMSLVQRLTGVNSSPTAAAVAAAEFSQPSPGAFPSPGPAGCLSPAARLATIEKAHQQSVADHHHHPYRPQNNSGELETIFEQFEPSSSAAAALGYRSGGNSMPFAPPAILSPNPSSLPAISPGFFDTGASDLNSLGFLQDLFSLSPMASSAAVSAAATSMVTTAAAAPQPPPPPATPGANRGGFTDNSFLLSPPSGSYLPFASSLLMASPGGFWDRPAGLGFTPNASAPSPNWDLFGSFPDL